MSDSSSKFSLSSEAKRNFGIGAIVLAAIGAVAGFRSYKFVEPDKFGVEVLGGKVQDKILTPDLYKKYPIFDTIHTFNNNVIILETNIGDGKNTQDQNSFCAAVRLHYQIDKDAGILAFHLDEMSSNNGETLLTAQMSKAMNAVVGQRTTPQTLASPEAVLNDFVTSLEWRLKQNNIAAKIDTVEYLTAYVGTTCGETGSGLRLPVQLRKKPGQAVESMAGPSSATVVRPGSTELAPKP